MPATARIVIPGIPHHITQRGSRGLEVFLEETDYATYLTLLAESCQKAGTRVLAWCLMPNHVHLVMVPADGDGLRRALAEPHRIYARMINEREGWQGHLWQDRFASFPMDEEHLVAALRYVELNPVRAGLVTTPEQWKWSSALGHLSGHGDKLVRDLAPLTVVGDWAAFLASGLDSDAEQQFARHLTQSRPLGNSEFVSRLEVLTGHELRPRKRGPRKR